MPRPDPADYGTDGNRHALDAREYDDEQDDDPPPPPQTHHARSPLHDGGRTVIQNQSAKLNIIVMTVCVAAVAASVAWHWLEFGPSVALLDARASEPHCTRNVCHMPLEE